MFKEAIQYLVSLKDNKTYEIHGETYSDHPLHRVEPHVDRPERFDVTGLDSIVKLIRAEKDMAAQFPIFIRVVNPRTVSVVGSLDEYMSRDYFYRAACDATEWVPGWRDQEKAIIELRSMFAPTEDVEYLLSLISSISKNDGVSSEDNGVSQTVTATMGVALKQVVPVKPRVTLAPFRTFLEVEQPASEFILRLDNNASIGLLEADGGMWKMEAKKNIVAYFETALKEEIEQGAVVVMM